jgi:hypothetical protein
MPPTLDQYLPVDEELKAYVPNGVIIYNYSILN